MGKEGERDKLRTTGSPHQWVLVGASGCQQGSHIPGCPQVYSVSIPSAIPTPHTCWLNPIKHMALCMLERVDTDHYVTAPFEH